ncbi:MAG: lanthionine synthetase LanC family protein [bacterium]
MAITDPHVLPPDLVIMPVDELADDVRAQITFQAGDFAVTRPRSRTPPKIIDAHAGELLMGFTTARGIVDVVVEFSAKHQLDPTQLLDDAFPMLQRFVDAGLLVEPGSERAKLISALHTDGDQVSSWEVVSCIQVLEDVELYQVRRIGAPGQIAALKIARRPDGDIAAMIDREARALEQLNGSISPRLLEEGSVDGRRFVVIEWRQGVNVHQAAHELRASHGPTDRLRLLQLCRAIADAYGELHARGVIHGDVHERNLLVDAQGRVTMLDFGLSRRAADTRRTSVQRGGVARYFEPEYGAAHRDGRQAPIATMAGEQYSVASLLYLLFTGVTSLDFSAELPMAMKQIAEEPSLRLSARGALPFPALEDVLLRALSKGPAERFATARDFAGALRQCEQALSLDVVMPPGNDDLTQRCLATAPLFMQFDHDGETFTRGLTDAPTANVSFGAAGVAYALYRLSLVRGDAALLSLADIWAGRAERQGRSRSGYYNTAMGLGPDGLGRASLYHTAPGVHVVRALIARAMGDVVTMQVAIDAFAVAASRPTPNIDLTLGAAGLLLGCALLLESLPDSDLVEPAVLQTLGDRLARRLWRRLRSEPPIGSASPLRSLGIAHGWAGYLYATLRWQQASGHALGINTVERLHELAARAEPEGRGLHWRWVDNGAATGVHGYMSGWCNGSAGFVHLWLTAHDVTGEGRFQEMAEGAAWNAWESEDGDDYVDLCCGLAGRSYALLAMYRHTGSAMWLHRARDLAARSISFQSEEDMWASGGTSLYKSPLGAALLAEEIERPDFARMPLFEAEGWPRYTQSR